MKQTQFSVGKHNFRNKNLAPTEALALETIVQFDNFEKSKHMYDKIFESIEVQIGDTWQPLKEQNVDVYMPVGIDEDLTLLNEVAMTFIVKVLQPLFQKSTELKEEQKAQQ